MQLTQKQTVNFWNKVEKTKGCWNWQGSLNTGYGRANINGDVFLAHKLSLVIAGKLKKARKKELGAKGQIVMHKCDNRKCVNPQHLVLATQKENMQDARIKGRKWYGETSGENNGRAKLNWKDVKKIKSLIGKFTYREIAKRFGVDFTQIYCINIGKTWRTT